MDLTNLNKLLQTVTIEILQYVSSNEVEYFSSNYSLHNDYPNLNYSLNGFPSFSTGIEARRNYYKFITRNGEHLERDSWKLLYSHLFENEQFCKYFQLKEFRSAQINDPQWQDKFTINHLVIKFIERYIHIFHTYEFKIEYFNKLFVEWTNSFILTKVQYDIIIPILMAQFDFDIYEIGPNISIIRMSDQLQKSRNTKSTSNVSTHDQVLSCATHAFVLKGNEFTNENFKSVSTLNDKIYSDETLNTKLDILFGMLRIETGANLGFCQIIILPDNWAISWQTDLVPIYISTVKMYPDFLENYYWHKPPSLIPQSSLDKRYKEVVHRSISSTVRIALKRLNNAYLYRYDDDSILDLTIGLEALLLENNDNNEITYKLSLRIATVFKILNSTSLTPFQIFTICKQIYRFRSSIVHGLGTKKIDKYRIQHIENAGPHNSIDLGLKILGECIIFFMNDSNTIEENYFEKHLLS